MFAQKQPDRPPNNYATGFVFYHGPSGLEPELEAFMENGDPPLVLALGSTAVMEPRKLIETFVQAAKRVGGRAVIQVSAEQRTSYASGQSKGLFVAGYVPYGALMPAPGASFTPAGSARRRRRCAVAAPCWQFRPATISWTTPITSAGWKSPG